ncbi:LamB/YcsF family protein [Planomicrobium sp. CPCC 101110]|uniref:LamB/YcsF family protein n=1 Tax=Planomicrobium sp. CPCC 101110 TaxID=2599619 RepID=UPI0011B65B8D|nr:5-oxoprolinase subunit PxpA [Planomicrobium sp. CPCC 101110]TWT24899.1 LamB/YcsF family protein [Planomicrobium sp. CPCC 101110]
MNYKVDLNCDMGESFGAYTMGHDADILDYVTSANIACGFHAGDPATMRKTVQLALDKNVGIGAHPGLQDLVGFGRRNMAISPQEAYDLTLYQIGALSGFVQAEGGRLQHVKAHGALYNMAAKNASLSEAIAEAVYKIDPELVLFGLSGSEIIKAGRNIGLRTASEVFSDRTYQPDATLTPRTQSNALITDPNTAISQVVRMVKENKVQTVENEDIEIQADTICIHGDGATALDFAVEISKTLRGTGIDVLKVSEFM